MSLTKTNGRRKNIVCNKNIFHWLIILSGTNYCLLENISEVFTFRETNEAF